MTVTKIKPICSTFELSIKYRIEVRKEYKNNFKQGIERIKKIINTEGEKFQQEKELMY